jgi:hypothetical protein
MKSKLFQTAEAALTPSEVDGLRSFEDRLSKIGLRSSEFVDGRQLVDNLQSETRMTGDGRPDDATVLSEFLRRCAQNVATSRMLLEGYASLCVDFAGEGQRILRGCLPDDLLRYTTNRRLASMMIERVLGLTARVNFDRGLLTAEDAFTKMEKFWTPAPDDSEEHLGGSFLFATFEEDAAPRDDAKAMAAALALPILLSPNLTDEFLYELTYPTDRVLRYKFPTVADASLAHVFRPCVDVPVHESHPLGCYGRTNPFNDAMPQPELLHEGETARILSAPPRYVGYLED